MLSRLHYAFWLLLALPSVGAAQLPQSTGLAASRLAFVSPQRAFYESNAGKLAEVTLVSLQEKRSKEVETRNARLRALQGALAQSTSVLGESARRQREQEIDEFQTDLQRFVEDAQAEFLGVRRNIENAFLAKFAPAVEAVAKDRGLLFVFNQDSGLLAWSDPTLDITTEVVTIVNQP